MTNFANNRNRSMEVFSQETLKLTSFCRIVIATEHEGIATAALQIASLKWFGILSMIKGLVDVPIGSW